MLSVDVLMAFVFSSLILHVSPGPSNLYVMARTLAQGMRGGVVASLGLAVGSLFHILAAVLGLSAIFEHSPVLYTSIKVLGGMYLLYLGITYWCTKSKNSETIIQPVKKKSLRRVFCESVIVEITNPKVAIFFIAFLPQFVVPESGPVTQQLLVLGIITIILAMPCDLMYAGLSNKMTGWLSKHKRAQEIQDRVSGFILFAMGSYIIANETYSMRKV